MVRGFFVPRPRPVQGGRHRDGIPCHDTTSSGERIRSLAAEFPPGRRTRTPARSGSLCGPTVCRRWAAAVPPLGRRRFRPLIRRNCRMRSSSPVVRSVQSSRLSSPVGTDPPGAPIVRQPPYHPWRGTPQGGNFNALVNSTEPGGTPMRARTLALIALLQALPAAAAGLTPLEQAGKKIL